MSAPGPYKKLVSQRPPAFYEEQETTEFKYTHVLTKQAPSLAYTGTHTQTHTEAHTDSARPPFPT